MIPGSLLESAQGEHPLPDENEIAQGTVAVVRGIPAAGRANAVAGFVAVVRGGMVALAAAAFDHERRSEAVDVAESPQESHRILDWTHCEQAAAELLEMRRYCCWSHL